MEEPSSVGTDREGGEEEERTGRVEDMAVMWMRREDEWCKDGVSECESG